MRSVFLYLLLFYAFLGCGAASGGTATLFRGDYRIPDSRPPSVYWQVPGGSCGEACLWTILGRKGIHRTQQQINADGRAPGRGLHSGELFRVLRRYGIAFRNISRSTVDIAGYIRTHLLPELKRGRLILLGVKTYPDPTPQWGVNHFILLTGYNLHRGELLFNSDTSRSRIAFRQLQRISSGLSLVSRQRYIFALLIL